MFNSTKFLLLLTATLVVTTSIPAQTNLTVLVNFNGINGAQPFGLLVQGPDGLLYGTANKGGDLTLNSGVGYGSVFKCTLDGKLTTLATFNYTNGEGPYAGLTFGPDGYLYGTTQLGGLYNNSGTIFRISTNGGLVTIVNFSGTNGAIPYAPLFLAQDGNFYGTTASGLPGTNAGTIYRFNTNGNLTTIAAFNGANGEAPYAGLVQATNGLLYGTTSAGGFDSYGLVYSVTTNGALSTVVEFEPPAPSPANPFGALAFGANGFLYGTTGGGGSNYDGTIFEITGSGVTNLVNFNNTNGSSITGQLILGRDGNLYGTASQGGQYNDGTIFEIANNVLTTLASFNYTNGEDPKLGLIQANDGNLYGVTQYGGTGKLGTLYRFAIANPSPAPSLSIFLEINNVVVKWIDPSADYTLQYSDGLTSTWSDVVPAATLVHGQYVSTNAIVSAAKYFRLIQNQ